MSRPNHFAPFSSIAAKIGVILVLLGGVAAAAIATAMVVFSSLSDSLDTAIDTVMPRIETSTETIKRSGTTSNAVAVLGAAESEAQRASAFDDYERDMRNLEQGVASLPVGAKASIQPVLSQLSADVQEMNEAISRRLEIEDHATDARGGERHTHNAPLMSGNRTTVDGAAAADLYQTYGVPPELFESLAAEHNLAFDWDGYAEVVLVPSNPALEEMRFDPAEVEIFGKVVTIMRRV